MAKNLSAPAQQTAPAVGSGAPQLIWTWNSYLARRGAESVLDQEIDTCRRTNNCTPLFRKWVRVIDAVNLIPPDMKYERVAVASYLTNQYLLHYNYEKSSFMGTVTFGSSWYQTPTETLGRYNGAAVCADYAALKYETLLRAGFTDHELQVVTGSTENESYHTVLAARIDGKDFIADMVPITVATGKGVRAFHDLPPLKLQNGSNFTRSAIPLTPQQATNNNGVYAYVPLSGQSGRSAPGQHFERLAQYLEEQPEIAQTLDGYLAGLTERRPLAMHQVLQTISGRKLQVKSKTEPAPALPSAPSASLAVTQPSLSPL